jgi:hypothetical protein
MQQACSYWRHLFYVHYKSLIVTGEIIKQVSIAQISSLSKASKVFNVISYCSYACAVNPVLTLVHLIPWSVFL